MNFKISTWQIISVISIIFFVPLLLTFPQHLAQTFGTGAVIQSIYSSIIMFILFWIIMKLHSKFQNKDFYEILEIAGGKKLLIIFGILLSLFLFATVSVAIEQFSETLKSVLFTNSEIEEIGILFGVGILFGGYFGFKGIFRSSSLIFPLILIGFALILLSLYSHIDLTNLTPILGAGADKIFIEGAFRIGRYYPIFLIGLFAPYINKMKTSGYWCVIISSLIAILTIFLVTSIIPYPTSTENYFAIYELTRLVEFGRFFQQFESVFMLLWLTAVFLYLGAIISIIQYTFKKIFNLQYTTRFLPAMACLISNTSMIYTNYTLILSIRNFLYIYVAPILCIIVPFLVLIIARIRHIGGSDELLQKNT